MAEASQELRFEYAARLRDEIKDLRRGVVEAELIRQRTGSRSVR